MSDDDWDDDDDDWDDDNNNADDGWDDNQMEEEENFGAHTQELSELEQLYEDADSDMSLRNKDMALTKFESFIVKSIEENNPKPELLLKALSSIVQLCTELEKKEKGLQFYKTLLEHLGAGQFSQNEKKSAMSDVLNQFDPGQNVIAEQYYKLTLDSIKNDERLCFDFSMELARSYLEVCAWDKLDPLVNKMHCQCQIDGTDDPNKADHLIQIYAVKIEQMFSTGDMSRLEEIYHLTNKLSANVSEYRSAPILAEFRGKYFSEQRDWGKAYGEFFEAIKYADPSRGKLCVRYLVLVTMLGEENADPFASREVKIYEQDRQVEPYVKLYNFFQENNIKRFDSLLETQAHNFVNDNFVKNLTPHIKLKLRKQALVQLIKPYKKLTLAWLEKQLFYTKAETEQLLIGMILDESIIARINQVEGTLEIRKTPNVAIYNQLKYWARSLNNRQQSLCRQVSNLEGSSRGAMPSMYMMGF